MTIHLFRFFLEGACRCFHRNGRLFYHNNGLRARILIFSEGKSDRAKVMGWSDTYHGANSPRRMWISNTTRLLHVTCVIGMVVKMILQVVHMNIAWNPCACVDPLHDSCCNILSSLESLLPLKTSTFSFIRRILNNKMLQCFLEPISVSIWLSTNLYCKHSQAFSIRVNMRDLHFSVKALALDRRLAWIYYVWHPRVHPIR